MISSNLIKYLCCIFIFLYISFVNAQQPDSSEWHFEYKGVKIQSHPSKKYIKENVLINIGEPFIIAAKDDSPDEGYFLAPVIYSLADKLFTSWKFDWDVVDSELPDKPHGRISYDGGKTWIKNNTILPLGSLYQTGEKEITSFFRNGFEVPGQPGNYKVPVWRSYDNGLTWGNTEWTDVAYPGTKGIDIYNPPGIYKLKDRNYTQGHTKSNPPQYLETFFNEVSRNRRQGGPIIEPQVTDSDGTIYSVTYGRPGLKSTENIKNWEKDYWEKINWDRYAVYLHTSKDNGRTWEYKGIVANGADYEGEIDFKPGDGFSEGALAVYPDGQLVIVMRTGSRKPLYLTKSTDNGSTWSHPELLLSNSGEPICGVRPRLVLLENQILVLATGRPDVTVHFSKNKGETWFSSEKLYTVGPKKKEKIINFANSHLNVSMSAVDKNKVLIVHDATRRDESEVNDWLKKHGHGLIIGRIITVKF